MALQQLSGATGYIAKRWSSMDKRAIGKLTDTNHLYSFHSESPAEYDKKIISLYQQSSLYSNDFLNMINKSTPFYITGNTDAWKWDIEVPYKFPTIIDVPATTINLAKPGIDGQEFEFVLDKQDFFMNDTITPHRMYGPSFLIIADALPWNDGFLYKATLVTANPKTDFVDKKFLQQGIEFSGTGNHIGEFDQELPGLGPMADRITMFESLGAGTGLKHTITDWADATELKDSTGKPLDIMVYMQERRNEVPITKNSIRWEPLVETKMRQKMLSNKVAKMIWSKPGTGKTRGSKQEIKKISAGVYHRMRSTGNYVPYNRGEFSVNLLRSVFGDLFYRRVPMGQRRVKMYTNEAGFDVFQQAIKQDAFDSGLTFNVGDNDKFIQGSGQSLVLNFAFDSVITRETGKIELVHLQELDLPQSNLEFGQNKKSTPVFMVFDVSPNSDGSLNNNIREVRKAGEPSMTWGYVHGTRHHLGHFASQGMESGNMFPGYTIWMKDRYDVFIEDMTRTVLIEEIPQF